jgi:methylmalonyl-CoA mutase N-terminal domain/subunit
MRANSYQRWVVQIKQGATMMSNEERAAVNAARERWEREAVEPVIQRRPERHAPFTSLSGEPVERLYTPADGVRDYVEELGFPGEFPFTRGIYPTMYRGQLWSMRQFAGFGSAAETNERFRYLLDQGMTGLSTAFDLPTLMGRDSDDPRCLGEVGRGGVAIDSAADMERLFAEIPLDRVTTSMTINGPAAILLAYYFVVAERRGIPFERLGGTTQNDILKEYIAQKEWLFPPEPSLRLVTDTVLFCAEQAPRWHPISISGYHIREAGATALEELAFTLIDGLTYVERAVAAGLDVDAFAPRLSFFFDAHIDFFEEIAKFRAARRIWAREMQRRYSPRDPRSLALRFHTQTAGCSLTAQQPLNNVVRVTLQALAAVLGGTQSLHTNSLDETYALPTAENALLALRTQQLIAHESGAVDTVDPLAGSYYVEALTRRMEEGFHEIAAEIDRLGGMVAAIEAGYPQRRITESADRYQREVEAGEKIVVGVNAFASEAPPIPTLKIPAEVETSQIERVRSLRASRDPIRWRQSLDRLRDAACSGAPMMAPLLDAARCDATVGEITAVLKEVFGEYREPAVF